MKTIKIKRKISSTLIRIKELEKFKGKNVEINLNINETDVEKRDKGKNLAGIFSQYADGSLLQNEKRAWELAVKEKHDNYRR
jgi:hypothetical protein